jgi:predicted acylesterase/phospholipase RssA
MGDDDKVNVAHFDRKPIPHPPPDTLVFSGGGPDGLAFIGCLRSLEDGHACGIPAIAPGSLRTVVGCSAGAIVALFVAVGMTSLEIEAWAKRGFEDRSLCDVDIEGIFTAVERLGIDDGERAMASVRSAVAKKLAAVAPRLCSASPGAAAGDPTFLELAKATGRNLVVCVTDLEAGERVLLSVDTAPDLGVALAVRMSISIPVLFTPVRARLRPSASMRTYVDGGLFDFCPLAHIVASRAATSTLAFRVTVDSSSLDQNDHGDPGDDEPPALSLVAYGGMIARALLMRSAVSLGAPPPPPTSTTTTTPTMVRTVDVPSLMLVDRPTVSFDTASFSLEIDPGGIDRYILHGMRCTETACVGDLHQTQNTLRRP